MSSDDASELSEPSSKHKWRVFIKYLILIGGIKPPEKIHKVLLHLETLWQRHEIIQDKVSFTQIVDNKWQIAIFLDVPESVANQIKSSLNQKIGIMRKEMHDLSKSPKRNS